MKHKLMAALPAAKTAVLALALLTLVGSAQAAAPNVLTQVQSTELSLLRALVQQGILTQDKAEDLLRKAGIDPAWLKYPNPAALPAPAGPPDAAAAGGAAPAPAAVPAPAPAAAPSIPITEATRREIIGEVQQEVRSQTRAEGWARRASLPLWVQQLSFSGDIRLRELRDDFASDNSPPSAIDNWYQLLPRTTPNTVDSHQHLQLRVRLNVDAKINDQFSAGVRLVTAGGNDATASPVEYDVELGRYARPYSAGISLSFLRWEPRAGLAITAGRMANPYFTSDLIFAPEFSLDGMAVTYARDVLGHWGGYVGAGAHPLQTSQQGPFNTASNQWLYAAQAGVDWKGTDLSHLRAGAAYYDFAGIQGQADPVNPANNTLNDTSAPLFRKLGNTMFNIRYQVLNNTSTAITPLYGYAAQFRLVNFGAEYEYARFDPLRLVARLDWVRNVGFNAAEVRQRIGADIAALPAVIGPNGTTINGVDRARTNGYLVNLRMGAAELLHRGDWQIFGGVRYLQRDAVPDAFTSPDYRLGGTDNQATFGGINLALSPAVSVTVRYISARSIDSGPKFGVDSWFIDLDGRF